MKLCEKMCFTLHIFMFHIQVAMMWSTQARLLMLCKVLFPCMTQQTSLLLVVWSDKQPQAFIVSLSLLKRRIML